MLECSERRIQHFESQAEREMAAFLQAAANLLGAGNVPGFGDLWIRTLESLDWPSANHERFFRRVTILAIAELISSAYSGLASPHNVQSPAAIRTGIPLTAASIPSRSLDFILPAPAQVGA